jgi:hypothetical protein
VLVEHQHLLPSQEDVQGSPEQGIRFGRGLQGTVWTGRREGTPAPDDTTMVLDIIRSIATYNGKC